MTETSWPCRMILRGWFRESWIDASAALRQEIFTTWLEVHREWQERGCRLIFTMDDTGAVGSVGDARCNFYTVWEIPDASVVRELLKPIWDEDGSRPLRLAEYFAVETIVGKPIFSMERGLGGTHHAAQVT